MPWTIRRLNLGPETFIGSTANTVAELRAYFVREWPKYRIELWEPTQDESEVYLTLVPMANDHHIRFHAKRVKG